MRVYTSMRTGTSMRTDTFLCRYPPLYDQVLQGQMHTQPKWHNTNMKKAKLSLSQNDNEMTRGK